MEDGPDGNRAGRHDNQYGFGSQLWGLRSAWRICFDPDGLYR